MNRLQAYQLEDQLNKLSKQISRMQNQIDLLFELVHKRLNPERKNKI